MIKAILDIVFSFEITMYLLKQLNVRVEGRLENATNAHARRLTTAKPNVKVKFQIVVDREIGYWYGVFISYAVYSHRRLFSLP